jgi:osmotically-inducible protein OsmY
MKSATAQAATPVPGPVVAAPAAPSSHPARPLVGSRVEGRDGFLGTVVDTRTGAGGAPPAAALLVRQAWSWRRGWRRPVRLVPLTWIRLAAHAGAPVLLDADSAMLTQCPPLRSDEALADDVRDALATGRDEHLPPRSLSGVQVTVAEGTVTLSGALPRVAYQRAALASAARVPGVLSVRDETFADEDLVTGVAQALLADPATRAAHLRVSCRNGEVWLDGTLPSDADVATATALAGAVPGIVAVHNGAIARLTRSPS